MNSWEARFPFPAPPTSLAGYLNWLIGTNRYTAAVRGALQRAQNTVTPTIYIAGALTEASEAEKERYTITSELCAGYDLFGYAPHLYGTDPVKHPHVTDDEVRDVDYLWAVVMPEFHINFLDPMARGNNIEEGWAEGFHIPTVYCVPKNLKLSRLSKGMLNIATWITYIDHGDLYQQLEDLLTKIAVFRAKFLTSRVREFAESCFKS